MNTEPNRNVAPTGPVASDHPGKFSRLPRWAVAVLVLQSLTLLCVFGSNGTTPASGNTQYLQSRDDRPKGQTLPNSAQQRAEQTKLLARIVSELEKTNSKLDSLDSHLRSGDLQINQPTDR